MGIDRLGRNITWYEAGMKKVSRRNTHAIVFTRLERNIMA